MPKRRLHNSAIPKEQKKEDRHCEERNAVERCGNLRAAFKMASEKQIHIILDCRFAGLLTTL